MEDLSEVPLHGGPSSESLTGRGYKGTTEFLVKDREGKENH